MSFISNILGSGTAKVIESVSNAVDKFITTDSEKQEFRLKVQEIIQARESELEQTLRKELEAKERIIVAELQQSDNFTKRARPSVIYFGLFAIAFNYSFVPFARLFYEQVTEPFILPFEFWAAWGGIVSTYTISRTFDKRSNAKQNEKNQSIFER